MVGVTAEPWQMGSYLQSSHPKTFPHLLEIMLMPLSLISPALRYCSGMGKEHGRVTFSDYTSHKGLDAFRGYREANLSIVIEPL